VIVGRERMDGVWGEDVGIRVVDFAHVLKGSLGEYENNAHQECWKRSDILCTCAQGSP
jgi:hypothetical protein